MTFRINYLVSLPQGFCPFGQEIWIYLKFIGHLADQEYSLSVTFTMSNTVNGIDTSLILLMFFILVQSIYHENYKAREAYCVLSQ